MMDEKQAAEYLYALTQQYGILTIEQNFDYRLSINPNAHPRGKVFVSKFGKLIADYRYNIDGIRFGLDKLEESQEG